MEIEKIYSALFNDEVEEYLPDGCAHSEVFINNTNDGIFWKFILYDTTEQYASVNMTYGVVSLDSAGNFIDFTEFVNEIEKINIDKNIKNKYLEVVHSMYTLLCNNNTEKIKQLVETNLELFSVVFGSCADYVIGCLNINTSRG